jgi:phage terminase small subunit
VDVAVMTRYCLAWARMVEAEEEVSATGVTVVNDKGVPIMNPRSGPPSRPARRSG